MKAFKVMFVVFAMLLLAVPIAAARPAGLAAPVPVVASEQGSPCGVNSTPIYAAGYVSCVNADQTTSAAPKPAGLAKPAPALTGEQNLTLDWVDRQVRNGNPAAPAPVVASEQGSPCGVNSTPIYAAGYVSCVNAGQTASVAPKPAGLAKLAPALTEPWNGLPGRSETATLVAPEQSSQCVSLAGPNYSVCVVGSAAAGKPAGLARPAPSLTGEQNLQLDWIARQIRNGNLAVPVGASNQGGQD